MSTSGRATETEEERTETHIPGGPGGPESGSDGGSGPDKEMTNNQQTILGGAAGAGMGYVVGGPVGAFIGAVLGGVLSKEEEVPESTKIEYVEDDERLDS